MDFVCAQVLGCCNLPAWADLPSNDRASSQDLDEISFQVSHIQDLPAHFCQQAHKLRPEKMLTMHITHKHGYQIDHEGHILGADGLP